MLPGSSVLWSWYAFFIKLYRLHAWMWFVCLVRVIHEAVRKDSAVQDDATFASQIALVHVI